MALSLRALTAVMASLLVGQWGVSAASATETPEYKLAIEPVGEQATYFQRSLNPGESATLVVDLANYGSTGARVRTFAADVYSIINGGFGARLRDEQVTGATTWLDYPTQVFVLDSGQALRRDFTVTVPPATPPGEYITSVLIENEDPFATGEGVAVNQFVRSAVAIVITVPGPTQAELGLGEARHSFLDGRSVVGVGIENLGDLLLRPAGSFAIVTEAGASVDARSVAMDSVYAHTATSLEVVLDRALAPGRYLAVLDIADAERDASASGERPFVVGEDAAGTGTNPSPRSTDTIDLPVIGQVDPNNVTLPIWIVGMAIGAIVVLLLMSWRGRRSRASG